MPSNIQRLERRSHAPRLALMAAIVVVVASLGLSAAPSSFARPPADFLGVTAEDTLNKPSPPAYRTTAFQAQRAAGMGLIRQTMDWGLIERFPGNYDFIFYDGFVAATATAGLTIMPILHNAPLFLSKAPKSNPLRGNYPPKRPADMAKFAAAAVRRYGAKGSFWKENPSVPKRPIRVWQVWNEPNLPIYWRPKPSARQYVRLLATVGRAIKKADPGAKVMTAGLPDSKNGIPLATYVRSMYRTRARGQFDILAINAFSSTASGAVAKLRSIRTLMNSARDRKAQMWMTEIGWADSGPRSPYTIGARQAREVANLLTLAGRSRRPLKLRGVVYFNWRDSTPYAGFRDFFGLHTGLLRLDGSPKPALVSFAKAAKGLK